MGRRGHRPGDGWVEPVPPKPKRERSTQHRELCLLAAKWLRRARNGWYSFPYVAVELATQLDEQPDVFGWAYWATVLIEVKVSRSDFLTDAKKPFRKNPEDGVGAFRFYCCPAGLIQIDDLPKGWGLLWETDGKIEVKRTAEPQPALRQAEINLLSSIMRREGVKPQVFDYRK